MTKTRCAVVGIGTLGAVMACLGNGCSGSSHSGASTQGATDGAASSQGTGSSSAADAGGDAGRRDAAAADAATVAANDGGGVSDAGVDGAVSAPGVASVCRFTTPVTYGPPGDDGLIDVPPTDPNIYYSGRIDCANAAGPQFAYPGISIRARFTGDTIQMKLTDYGTGTATTTNHYDIIVDGQSPTELTVSPTQVVYTLATGLGAGEHTVEVFRRNESNVGKGVFNGFRIRAGSTLLAPTARPHRIEFIGDSITCGYGDMLGSPPGSGVADPSNAHFTSANENADLAWSALSARDLDAELTIVAYSGRGVYRNYEDAAGDTLPEMYLKILPDDPASPKWDPATAVPDVVVINLGTNDFSAVPLADGGLGAVDNAAYVSAFTKFLDTLRGYYPKATFVLAEGPMLSNSYPTGYNAFTTVHSDLLAIASDRADAGDPNVQTIFFGPQSAPYGEDYHPTAAEQATMSSALVTLVKQLEGW